MGAGEITESTELAWQRETALRRVADEGRVRILSSKPDGATTEAMRGAAYDF
jgi:hypothetical protein